MKSVNISIKASDIDGIYTGDIEEKRIAYKKSFNGKEGPFVWFKNNGIYGFDQIYALSGMDEIKNAHKILGDIINEFTKKEIITS